MSNLRAYERALVELSYPQMEYHQMNYGEPVTATAGTLAVISAVTPLVSNMIGSFAGGRRAKKQAELQAKQQQELLLAQQQAELQLAIATQNAQARQRAMMPVYFIGGVGVVGLLALLATRKGKKS